MALAVGDVIDGKYRIIRLLGEGGMGAVYEGENLRIHRSVAIKVLHSGVADNKEAVERFEREAQAAGRIGSEHIVEVLDLGNLPDGDRYMVMEFMQGDSLSKRIELRGKLTPRETYAVARQILEGLAAAHGAGIIHRDLKPDNVYLLRSRGGQADFVKILDFGISKFSKQTGEPGFSMTRTGAVMGTPYYMSPEQAKGAKDLDQRGDIYAVGVILYECVTGRVPFNADTFNELLFKIVLEAPEPIVKIVPDSDPSFNAIIEKAMARDRDVRYQSCTEFQQALDAWATGAGVPAAVVAAAPAPAIAAAPPAAAPSGAPPARSGTQGAWANTGGPRVPARSNAGLIAATAAGVLLFASGIGFLVFRGSHGSTSAAASAAPSGPTPEELRAMASAAEAKRAAEALEKDAEEKLRKAAEEEARAAEEAKQAALQAKPDPTKAVAVAKPRTAGPAPAKPAPAPKTDGTSGSAASTSGRKIRTEL